MLQIRLFFYKQNKQNTRKKGIIKGIYLENPESEIFYESDDEYKKRLKKYSNRLIYTIDNLKNTRIYAGDLLQFESFITSCYIESDDEYEQRKIDEVRDKQIFDFEETRISEYLPDDVKKMITGFFKNDFYVDTNSYQYIELVKDYLEMRYYFFENELEILLYNEEDILPIYNKHSDIINGFQEIDGYINDLCENIDLIDYILGKASILLEKIIGDYKFNFVKIKITSLNTITDLYDDDKTMKLKNIYNKYMKQFEKNGLNDKK